MTYVAAVMIVAAIALFVAAPLTEGVRCRRRIDADAPEIERIDHEWALAMQGLRELEFDHAMGKVDAADYQNLRATLENRALAAMTALDQARDERREAARRVNFCPRCGARGASGHYLCAECGASLAPGTCPAAAQAK